jgi:hypothetical protein
MMDVRPGGLQMANPECTCQVTVKPGVQRQPGEPGEEHPGHGPHPGHPHPDKMPGVPYDNPACEDTVLPSGDCRPDLLEALAADLAMLRVQLRRDLGQGA